MNARYRTKWTANGGPVSWPVRSPDLNPLDYFLCGHLKVLVYDAAVERKKDSVPRFQAAWDGIGNTPGIIFEHVRQSMSCRCAPCSNVRGRHFEQLLWLLRKHLPLWKSPIFNATLIIRTVTSRLQDGTCALPWTYACFCFQVSLKPFSPDCLITARNCIFSAEYLEHK
jgi:hypothetical protein